MKLKGEARRIPMATTFRPEDAAEIRAIAEARGLTIAQILRRPVLGWLRRVRREVMGEEANTCPTPSP